MTERGAHQYEFRCPHCNERVQVDADVRDLLLASGCVVCGEGLSEAAFGDEALPTRRSSSTPPSTTSTSS